jgi:ketosteroid isomerase-like protein
VTSEPDAVRAGRAFIEALDRGRLRDLAALCAADATWWVDTGPDRVAGDRHGPARDLDLDRFPLHGRVRVREKLDLMRSLGPSVFPTGVRQLVERAFGTVQRAVIELEGDGVHASGRPYHNRYGFVFELDADGQISQVREYLDTIHAFDVLGAGQLPTRTALAPPTGRSPVAGPSSRPVELAMAIWPALSNGDLDALDALFAPGARWWVDSGTDRDHGSRTRHNGSPDGWPFHGSVLMVDKLADMRGRLTASYRSAGVTVVPIAWFEADGLVAVEAAGHADLSAGTVYQNRYLFVIEAGADGIHEVREYCDTLHVADIMAIDVGLAR